MQNDRVEPLAKKYFIPDFIQSIKESFKVQPHSLEEIREQIDEDIQLNVNFLDLLEKHHDYLKECISILDDDNCIAEEKQEALSRFIHLVNMHGNAEEETLYRSLILNNVSEARLQGIGGQDEHDLAYQLADELEDMNFEYHWTEDVDAKAKVLGHLISNHIKEEENRMFTVAKKYLGKDELNLLSAEYLDRCKKYLDSWGIFPPTGGVAVTTPILNYNEPSFGSF
jgi:hemerythrin-like domain-containing protein